MVRLCCISPIWVIRLVSFIQALIWALVLPSFTDIVTDFFPNDVSAAAGFITSAEVASKTIRFIICPIMGSLSDSIGRRIPILIAVVFLAIAWGVLILDINYGTLIICVIFRGLSDIFNPVITAALYDVSSPEDFSHEFGRMGAFNGIGLIVGSGLGGIVSKIHHLLPFGVAFLIGAADFLFIFFCFPETLPQQERRPFSMKSLNPFVVFKIFLPSSTYVKDPHFFSIMSLGYFFYTLSGTFVPVVNLHNKVRYGWEAEMNGYFMATFGLLVAIQIGIVLRCVLKRWSNEERLLQIFLCIYSLQYLAFVFSVYGWMLFMTMIIFSPGIMSQPLMRGQLTKAIDKSSGGLLQGGLIGIKSIADISGPFVVGSLLSYSVSDDAPIKLPGSIFLVMSVMAMTSTVVVRYAYSVSDIKKRMSIELVNLEPASINGESFSFDSNGIKTPPPILITHLDHDNNIYDKCHMLDAAQEKINPPVNLM